MDDLIFGIILYISDKNRNHKKIKTNFNFKNVAIIGFMQVLLLVPGVSRSEYVLRVQDS